MKNTEPFSEILFNKTEVYNLFEVYNLLCKYY